MNPVRLSPFLLLTLVACSDTKHEEIAHVHAEDEHVHIAPHDGTMIELGEHFANLELVLDSEAGELQAWVHDAHAERSIRLSMKRLPLAISLGDGTRFDLGLEPVENVLTGETVGDSSQFQARHEKLVGVTSFEAFLPTIVIKGETLLAVGFAYPSGEITPPQTKEKAK